MQLGKKREGKGRERRKKSEKVRRKEKNCYV
jgi:hypothetical protein